MEDANNTDLKSIIRGVIEEFTRTEQARAEPAYKAELLDERKRREELEQRLNELVQENQRSRNLAEQAERSSTIRNELQRLGVAKVDLAYRVVKDDIQRAENGELVARNGQSEMPLKEYLSQFVQDNPELLPARIAGGSGMSSTSKTLPGSAGLSLDKIRPGMNAEELDKFRQEVSRVANLTLRGL